MGLSFFFKHLHTQIPENLEQHIQSKSDSPSVLPLHDLHFTEPSSRSPAASEAMAFTDFVQLTTGAAKIDARYDAEPTNEPDRSEDIGDIAKAKVPPGCGVPGSCGGLGGVAQIVILEQVCVLLGTGLRGP